MDIGFNGTGDLLYTWGAATQHPQPPTISLDLDLFTAGGRPWYVPLMVHPLYAGSFDPPTRGHIDLCERALALFGSLVIGIGRNPAKQGLFSPDERCEMFREAMGPRKGLEIEQFQGLVVDFARDRGCDALVRGLRDVRDFSYEWDMAHSNRRLAQDAGRAEIETLFLIPGLELSFASSSLIKEIVQNGGDASPWLHPEIEARLRARLQAREDS